MWRNTNHQEARDFSMDGLGGSVEYNSNLHAFQANDMLAYTVRIIIHRA